MGTGFDCFDVKANTAVPGPQHGAAAKPQDAGRRNGAPRLQELDKEWWHFTLENEPYPDTVFDFPIEPRDTRPTDGSMSQPAPE